MNRLLPVLLIAGLLGNPMPQPGAKIERAIDYGPRSAPSVRERRLDLYLPPSGRDFPTVVFFHGGGLSESGERRDAQMYAGVCPALAAAGVGCATADYRLAPAFTWPAMPEDAAMAVAWVKANIAQRRGDPARVFVFGHSSGCQLAAVLGTNPRFLHAHGLATRDLAGVIAMGCVLSPTEEVLARYPIETLRARWKTADEVAHATADTWLDADPSRFIGAHVPPLLVLIAERERFFPAILEQGAKFARRLLELERPADVVILPGGHVSSIAQFGRPQDPAIAVVLGFIRNPARKPE